MRGLTALGVAVVVCLVFVAWITYNVLVLTFEDPTGSYVMYGPILAATFGGLLLIRNERLKQLGIAIAVGSVTSIGLFVAYALIYVYPRIS